MKPEELRRGLKLLFEHFWIIRDTQPEEYNFLRRHQQFLQKELRQRFGLNLSIRPQSIQVLKRPQNLAPWMGEMGFSSQLDYALFCCAMAYVEDLEANTPFMLDELIRSLTLLVPEEIVLDWTNYNHRKSLVRVVKKMLTLYLIETIQGETSEFEQSEMNQEVLFMTTAQARAFLARAPKSYTNYQNFAAYWDDFKQSQHLEGNQLIYQQLLMEPRIVRTADNEEAFTRLRNYYARLREYVEGNTYFNFELYRDYAAFTLEQQDGWQEIFPSRKVIDEILIQLATILRQDKLTPSSLGVITLSALQWQELIRHLQENYRGYWSKEFSEMTLTQLELTLLARGLEWHLFETDETQHTIKIQPAYSRLVAEMRQDDE